MSVVDRKEQGGALPRQDEDRATHERNPQAVSAVPVGIPSALEFDLAFEAAARPEQELSLDWILLGVNRTAEAFVMDADSDFFAVDLLPEFWADDNGIDYPPLAVGMYLMTDIVITPNSDGDPTFKGKIEPVATIAQAIEARRAATGTGAVHESPVGNADAPAPDSPPHSTKEPDHGE